MVSCLVGGAQRHGVINTLAPMRCCEVETGEMGQLGTGGSGPKEAGASLGETHLSRPFREVDNTAAS